jgi:8-oxo-dGTP pyrophosphatase MutT (NUDIX family)
MGTALRAKVVQRGILLREHDGQREALLMRNADGTWELPGGKIEHGDTAAESLEREVAEETGLTVTDAEPVEATVRKLKQKKRGKFAVVYRCDYEGGSDDVQVSDEHVDCAWVDYAEVGELNLKQVDEYRSLRRVLAERGDADETPDVGDDSTAEGVSR